MFAMDMPDVPPQYAPVVIAQAPQVPPPAQQVSAKIDRTIGVCHLIQNSPNPPGTAVNALSPLGSVSDYMITVEKNYLGLKGAVTILEGPEHGELKVTPSGNYRYYPASDYHGNDRATFLVEIGGFKIKAIYFFKVGASAWGGTEGYDPYLDKENCPQGPKWKISLNPADSNDQLLTFNSSTQLTNYLAGVINANINIADLTDSAVGQTTGTTITLDTNAAGHGWFIDSTPGSNEEWLPTHNPNEWIAKEGSDAAGKMDMLSVLLHEYGHVLGIGHSANGHDLMATTLTPGMRRMPTTDELALMAELVVGLKADLQTSSVTNSVTTNPSDSPLPFPWLPLDSTLGLAFLGRLRSRLSGLASNDAALTPTLSQREREMVQYDVVANPTLVNGNLDATNGWLSQGSVAFANGAAVLNEVSASQTRLSQVFMVGKEGNA